MDKDKREARTVVPQSAVDEATRQIRRLKDPRIEVRLQGKFLYVSADGDPLCRFTYDGSDSEWRFALYRYSRSSYSSDVFPYPSRGRIDEGIQIALQIYNLA